jgi:hypothetical protein
MLHPLPLLVWQDPAPACHPTLLVRTHQP